MRPAKGVPIQLMVGGFFTEENHFQAEEFFGDVDYLMIPQHPTSPPTRDALLTIYAEYIDSHFAEMSVSSDWIIMRRFPLGRGNGG
jgi:hypothetical protein